MPVISAVQAPSDCDPDADPETRRAQRLRKEHTKSAAGTDAGLLLGGGGEDIGPAERGGVPEVFLAVDLKK